jgi:signal transduction histidine kinase/AraC-like DNA-binding protein/ABC-type sugar transport system substrate-binding protein/ActR/RegA family two-component response regulator
MYNQSGNAFSPRIGVIVIPTDPYWVQALEAIIHTSQKLGDDLVVLQPAATLEDLYMTSPDDLVDQILAHDLDALISTLVSTQVLDALVSEGLPVICLSELDFRHPLFSSMSSLYDGGKMAGQYVAEKLCGKGLALCLTAGLEKIATRGQSRFDGFIDALHAFPGIEVRELPCYWEYSQAYASLLESLKDYPDPIDAMFGVSDAIILAARDAGRKLGIVTDKTILVGLNGDPLALSAVAEGSVSATIDTASEQVGALAYERARGAALGAPLPDVVAQRFQLITRENVASIATQKLIAIADIPSHMVGYNREQEHDRLSQLEISMEITRQIGSLMDRNRLVQAISNLVHQNYGYEWMRILRWSEKEQRLVFYEGNVSPVSQQVPIDQDQLLHQVFITNEMVFIPDLQTSRRWHMGDEWKEVRARAVLPIQLGSAVIGILDLQSSQPVRRPSLEIVGLELLARQLGIAIQNADLYLEAVQAREVAERANQLKARLIANVGHEMRTPLNSILGFSQAIQKKVVANHTVDEDELNQDLGHIYRSGEHLMYMINDLLDLSRAEIGALNLYFEPVELVPFLNELFWSFAKSETVSTNIQWVLDIPNQLPVIRADVVRLRQILINLLANAAKYTRQGTITLGAEVELPYLHLWVQDTGQGVSAEVQAKIFEPFATTGRKRRPEGIGLGLSITRHLVSLHDGVITLESQPGKGSTFHVYLPLPGVFQEVSHTAAASGPAAMLIVSTHSQIPEELQRICHRQGLVPRLISSKDDLTQIMAECSPAAVAWDLAHAASNEWNLIARLGAHEKSAALPVILYGLDETSNELTTGLTNVVFKPCNGNTLKDWISQADMPEDSGNTILVVDDDPQAREYYQGLLHESSPDSRILLAENGGKAIEILKGETPKLILLDLMMPEVDGFTVLEHVRGDIRTQRIPVIVISGKLLTYEDIQRLNYYRTVFLTKGILDGEETTAFLSQVEEEARPLPQPTSMLIKQVLAFLHQNYARAINRKDIAEEVGVSENYLSQIFRQEMSISPWDYLNRLRVQKSKELLKQTQWSVTQIATMVGYNDSAYFSRVFHKITGQSPVDFRQGQR